MKNTSCAHNYNSYLRGQLDMLGKYQVAFSTNARNGNFNQKNPQQQREYQRIKNRQKERNNRGEQNIYPDSLNNSSTCKT